MCHVHVPSSDLTIEHLYSHTVLFISTSVRIQYKSRYLPNGFIKFLEVAPQLASLIRNVIHLGNEETDHGA